ncbi:zinc-dependent alcohol dehydrogenase [Truepera radiovictrix]|uniref:Alcohol dehydrogenase zinc-binding domain protein n=1 Tax=Truepera radiovictrix (strain DSM 17093 / CIP 108686 / LMG 22925 / RQ-24) TaxID=649638 RepID=D7CRX0_TRURR|nr:zinc-binding dehydrogenase [Truepera radiovictrix]ADI15298.1 Alcohol dehydrogenase zinc-binding domain protein [Truepera radiovictrix DSM 17093]WMT56151.1 zinc-binding dehydrogenase [Truepera radiovictrix]
MTRTPPDTLPSTMRALVLTRIGELQLREVPLPEPQPGDALLKVRAVGVCGSDLHGYTGRTGRRVPPLVMGHEATAEVVGVGEGVDLPIGTRVAVHPIVQTARGRRLMGMDAPGAYAEYVVWPARNLYPLPETLDFEAGAFAEPLAVAVHAVNFIPLGPEDTVFIAGAGPIGLLCASVLLHAGVQQVVVSDTSAARLGVARAIGVHAALNPAETDLPAALQDLTGGRGADACIEAVGVSATVAQALDCAKDGGTVVWLGNNARVVEVDMQTVVTRELRVLGSYGMSHEDFRQALELLAGGHIPTAELVHRRARLEEGATLFDELLASPEVVKCLITPHR